MKRGWSMFSAKAAALSFLLGVSALVHASDVMVNLPITQVTVYQKNAMVSRSGPVNFPAGNHQIVIKGLPPGIESKTLRVDVESNAVQLGGVELTTNNESNFVSAAERELRAKYQERIDQRSLIEDEIANAQMQIKLLDSLSANPVGSSTKAAVDASNLGVVLSTMANAAASARAKIHDADLRKRAINEEIEKIKADILKVGTEKKQSSEIRVAIETKTAVTSPFTLTYAVDDAGWKWVYQARLDSVKKKVSFDRQGEVRQGSGEDWKDVQLTLTTSAPSDDVATPTIAPQFLDLESTVMKQSAGKGRGNDKYSSGGNNLEEIVVTGMRAAVSATQYSVEYRVPGRVTLLADRESRIYPIASEVFDTKLVARVVPEVRQAAFLEARFKFQNDVPIEAGTLQLYRDGAFVGEAESQSFLPGAEVRIPFGKDERIRVNIRNEAANSSETGFINKQLVAEKKQRFEITNYHDVTIPVEVLDRIPVSKNSEIKVETLKGATEPTTKDFGGKAGVLMWQVEAQPQKLVTIKHYFSVRSPKDKPIEVSEENPDSE